MRTVINEQPVFFQSAASGVSAYTVEEVTLTAPQSGDSDIIQLSLNFPSSFSDSSHTDGLYNPRMWFENLPQLSGVEWEWEMSTSLVDPEGTLLAGTAVPTVYQYNAATEDGAIDKATYYAATKLSWIDIQITAGAAATTYDTDEQARDNPRLVVEWDRMDEGFLDNSFLSPESDHLWDFSECDIYIDDIISVDSTNYTNRFKLGWIADEDIELNLAEETVEFLKGKPTATAVTFTSALTNEITAQIATFDPKAMQYILGINPTDTNGYLQYTQTNKQRNKQTFNISIEWKLNSGYRVRLKIPKAQFTLNGAFSPGAAEIVKIPVMIKPLVNPSTRTTYVLEVSKSPVQTAMLPFNFSITA